MATLYAKNPAELVIQNPAKKKTKTKSTKKMARKKRNNKGRFVSKKRSNPSGDFVDTGKNLFMKFGLAAVAATGVTKAVAIAVSKANLPGMVKDAVIIGGPAVAGIATSMFAGKNNAIAQGIAGGMVLASVNSATDKFLPKESGLSDSDMIVKADGYVYDQAGNPIAQIGTQEPAALPEKSSAFAKSEDNTLGDFVDSYSYEGGEMWQP